MNIVNGSDLRKMRLLGGLTTKAMAKAAGVKSRKTYENWEKNKSTPNINQFFTMAHACGLEPSQLIDFCEFKMQFSVHVEGAHT